MKNEAFHFTEKWTLINELLRANLSSPVPVSLLKFEMLYQTCAFGRSCCCCCCCYVRVVKYEVRGKRNNNWTNLA